MESIAQEDENCSSLSSVYETLSLELSECRKLMVVFAMSSEMFAGYLVSLANQSLSCSLCISMDPFDLVLCCRVYLSREPFFPLLVCSPVPLHSSSLFDL